MLIKHEKNENGICEFIDPKDHSKITSNAKSCRSGNCNVFPSTHPGMEQCDTRTLEQIEKSQCMFTCSLSTAPGGAIVTKVLDAGIIGAGAVFGERTSICNLICGVQHGF